MTDPYTAACPVYRQAQRTNQSNGQGWDLRPYDMKTRFWWGVGQAAYALFNWKSAFGLSLLGACVWLWVRG